jgi:TrpR family trp operon transcriptional repressor
MAGSSQKSIGKSQGLRKMSSLLHSLPDSAAIEEFLQVLFTPQELQQIPQRLAILELLSKGATQREIASSLGVGIATVTRGAREMKGTDLSKYFRK